MSQAVLELRDPGPQVSSGHVDSRPLGRVLVDLGLLRDRDVERVLALHRKKGLRFGEAACTIGLIAPEDVRQALSIQFNYPYVQRGQGALSPELIAAYNPFHPQSEALREVRTELLTHWLSPQRKVVAVVSPTPGEGRSYLAANLAVSFAQLGEKTLLIDADLRTPRQHRVFGLGGGAGLARALAGGLGIGISEHIACFDSLSVLAAGAAPPNPLELLSHGDLRRLLGEARAEYSVVIVDTAAASRGADARLTAARADGALLLAHRDRTRLADLDGLRGAVVASGVPIVAAVFNGA